MKKLLSILVVLALVFSFTACSEEEVKVPSIYDVELTKAVDVEVVKAEDFKIGIILQKDQTNPFDNGICENVYSIIDLFGLKREQVVIKSNVEPKESCLTVVDQLANAGCNIIFADSSEYEEFMIESAKDYKSIQFCVVGAKKAKTEKVGNFHSVYATVYESRYLTGVAAGMKLKELVSSGEVKKGKAKLGFVAAFDSAESISAYTSFLLGAQSVYDDATLSVKYVGSRFDETAEKAAVEALVDEGCAILSYDTSSKFVSAACEGEKVFCVGYNFDAAAEFPNTTIVSSRINWDSYFDFIISAALNGASIPTDYTVSGDVGGVEVLGVNENVAAKGTKIYIESARAMMINRQLNVFDVKSFKVDEKTLDSYLADVVVDKKNTPDSEAIANGCFNESAMRSAPYFDIIIDGVKIVK